MCNCNGWARTFSETDNGRYAPANHHPGCEDFKQEKFVRLEHDGSSVIVEANEVSAIVAGYEEQFNVEPVMLSRDQFEAMAEFQGF